MEMVDEEVNKEVDVEVDEETQLDFACIPCRDVR